MKFSLLQKYHINTLDEIIGQTNNVSFLKNSLFKNLFYPLYLFSGMRGSGKTTSARLFSLSLLCEKLSEFQKNPLSAPLPCYSCYSCLLYKKNQHPDIIELDAASHNGIDTIRSVIDNTYMLPIACKKKIYIIDEVHMLSKAAFNACLKIMEEPPENVHFILATTEIDKVIDTIKSRSIILYFKPIHQNILFNYIRNIASAQNIVIENKEINTIVDLSEGSVRDALNILNRLVMIDTHITEEIITAEYGIIEKNEVESLLKNILEKNITQYYEKKNKLALAELGKKKFFEYGILFIQKLLQDEYINKKNNYSIATLHSVLLHFYEYEEFFFTSQNPLGLFDLLLERPNTNTQNLDRTKNSFIEKNNNNIAVNTSVINNTTQEETAPNTIPANTQIIEFLKNLETIVNTILSQGKITINNETKKLSVLLKKNFSFYKDFLLSRDSHIKETIKKTFGSLYSIEYIFEDIETSENLTPKANEKKNINIVENTINTTVPPRLDTKEDIRKQPSKYIKNDFANSKNNKKKISPESYSPLLKKISALFPGSATYIEKE
jgi:DNA polymerase III subunit gamma/tau